MKLLTWALGIILALLPTYLIRFNIVGIPTTLLEVMVGLFLIGCAGYILSSEARIKDAKNRIKSLGSTNLAVGVFILGAIISVIISPEHTRALGQLKAFFIEPILLFYAIVIVFKDSENIRVPIKLLFWSATAISILGIIQYYTNIWLPLRFWGNGEEVKRITSVFEYPNALALYLAPIFTFFLAIVSKKWLLLKRPGTIIGLVAMGSAILLTYSRGAWLGILAGIIILLIKQSGVPMKKWVPGAIVFLLLLSPLMYSRFKLTFHDGSSSERLSMYKIAANKIISNPLLGNGLYGFRSTLEHSNYSGEILNYPHDIILNFWLETGFLGLLGFGLIILLSVSRYRKNPSVVKLAATAFLVTLLVHGLVDAPYFKNDLSILFWFAISLFYLDSEK